MTPERQHDCSALFELGEGLTKENLPLAGGWAGALFRENQGPRLIKPVEGDSAARSSELIPPARHYLSCFFFLKGVLQCNRAGCLRNARREW